MNTSAKGEDLPTLEITLSGGGLRAAAYALGALLYLMHSGLNTKVKNISSVSGGSITNAFVACHFDFQKKDGFEEFRKSVASKLARKIAFGGLLQTWQSWAWGTGIVIIAVTLLLLAAAYIGSGQAIVGVSVALLFLSSWIIWREMTCNGLLQLWQGSAWGVSVQITGLALLLLLTIFVDSERPNYGALGLFFFFPLGYSRQGSPAATFTFYERDTTRRGVRCS